MSAIEPEKEKNFSNLITPQMEYWAQALRNDAERALDHYEYLRKGKDEQVVQRAHLTPDIIRATFKKIGIEL